MRDAVARWLECEGCSSSVVNVRMNVRDAIARWLECEGCSSSVVRM